MKTKTTRKNIHRKNTGKISKNCLRSWEKKSNNKTAYYLTLSDQLFNRLIKKNEITFTGDNKIIEKEL